MAGRNVAFVNTIAGRCALSVNNANMPTPKGWAWAPLSDVARLESGHTPSRNHPEYWDGDIAWIGIKDAREHHAGVINDTSQHVTLAGIDNSAARVLPANTVCLSRTASVGYVVVMGRPMATSQDFVNWVCSPSLMPEYLKWALLAEGEEGLRKFGKGTTHTTIYFPEVEAFHVALAPLNEQRRIVARLDAIFEQTRAAKARLECLPALLEKLKRSILAAAFRGDLTKDWRAAHADVEPASALLDRIRAERRRRWENGLLAKGKDPRKATYDEPAAVTEQALPRLPTGWCWASVDDVSDLQLGQQRAPIHAAAEETHPYMRAANIKWGGLDLSDVKRMGFPDPERYRLREGDVLLSEASGSPSEVGKPAIWRGEIPDCCYQKTLLRARPVSADVSSEWLHAAFLADALLGRFARMAPGVGILHLTAERMFSWPIPMAPANEQREIVERIAVAMGAVARLEVVATKALATAERLEQSVLAKAFRGELVPQDPTDEPASVLLDRIRAARPTEPERPQRGRGQRGDNTAVPQAATRVASNGHTTNGHHDESLDLVVGMFQVDPRLTTTAITKATGLDTSAVKKALKILVDSGQVRVNGRARAATYEWSP